MNGDNKKETANNSPLEAGGMEYNFKDIEGKWQQHWKDAEIYKVSNPKPGDESAKPKYYVLDMFPYPSGAGLHVGHPLGYIASDIFSRYKRLKGYNVLHPMGFDSFGLPAEQYALDTGQHPAATTKNNIETFKKQLDNIGFCYDWDREVQTSDPNYYKWTQWIFLQLFGSWYNREKQKAENIAELIKKFETEGNAKQPLPDSGFRLQVSGNVKPETSNLFTAEQWKNFDEKAQQEILMQYRLAYCGYGEVNWCEALGTVLANDEVINGVSERGGHPVVKKKLRQWYLRITEYADRLLEGLERVDFSDAMKEMQTNWIGKSSGAEIEFQVRLTPGPSPHGEGGDSLSGRHFKTADKSSWPLLKDLGRENRKNQTEAEEVLWQKIRNNQLGVKVRRQHVIEGFIIDFAMLSEKLLIEVDGGYHNDKEQKEYDEQRTAFLNFEGYKVIRVTNDEVLSDVDVVINKIRKELEVSPLLREEKGVGDEAALRVYTTRPDTIFGVDFMVIAPEHELVEQITTKEQQQPVEEYLTYVKSRSERERMAEKKISGCFTGAYAINPFDGKEIPIWISEYVLAGYGTGAIMAVPCGDQRDFAFAKHFNIPVTNIIGTHFNGEEANATKEAVLENSGFLNGLVMKEAMEVAIKTIEEKGIGTRKVNYKMRDAAFSRQRYWGEPFPIVWRDGIAYPLDESELPLELPVVESYGPGPDGEGPLANIKEWALIPNPSPQVEKGAARVPKYSVHAPMQYELAKQMRKEYTEAEDTLWQLLRDNKTGFKFRRQHPIDAFIVDFICLQEKLIVEVDGGYHEDKEQKKYDEERTKALNHIGFDVIRFTNGEVMANPYEVRDKIKQKIEASAVIPPHPSGRGVGGEGDWVRETNTMPGYAGSSWYFLRYMDPHNDKAFCDRNISDYWGQVDLYIGGTEHAVGHLLYSRMWTKALYDLGYIGHDEPFKKLVNQGMITGYSPFLVANYIIDKNGGKISAFLSAKKLDSDKIEFEGGEYINTKTEAEICRLPLAWMTFKDGEYRIYKKDLGNLDLINGYYPLIFLPEDLNNKFFLKYLWETDSDGEDFICPRIENEKMSKSKYNVVNPDDIIEKYGADTFRMYEMFLGPVEMSKPWDTKGIEGVHRFLKKFWRLFMVDANSPLSTKGGGAGGGGMIVTDEAPTAAELKILHNTIKKIEQDTERFSFNTAVSTFMICVNELTDLKCHKKEILLPLIILMQPYAPHITEELYSLLEPSKALPSGEGLGKAEFPKFEEKYVKESSKAYPVAINGKTRTELTIALDASQKDVEEMVLQNEVVQKWLEGKPHKKIIYVKNKMINVVM